MTTLGAEAAAPLIEPRAQEELVDQRPTRFPAAQLILWFLMIAALAITYAAVSDALATGSDSHAKWSMDVTTRALGLVLLGFLPFLLMFVGAMKIRRSRAEMKYCLSLPPKAASEVATGAQTSWDYECQRYRNSGVRSQLYALILGLSASITLCACMTLTALGLQGSKLLASSGVRAAILSIALATITIFAIQFTRCIQRIATRDDTAAMFAWAIRAVVFVLIADAGFFALLWKATGEKTGLGTMGAALLGIAVGILGRDALRDFQTRAVEQLKIGKQPLTGADDLGRIAGMTDEDVERCGEEGVQSLSDLAFAPTARLFFNTGYSLQKIVDWQDQALLAIRVDSQRVEELSRQLGIRGATDLWDFAAQFGIAERISAGSPPTVLAAPAASSDTPSGGSAGDGRDPWSALRLVLGLSDGALVTTLWNVYCDETIRQLAVYKKAVVGIDAHG